MEDTLRHKFLVENPALKASGWLPPATEVPELAHLRSEHDRLIDAVAETQRAFSQLSQRRSNELEARRAARERAFLGGEPATLLSKLTTSDDQVADAAELVLTARDALQAFTRTAIDEVGSLEPALLAQLDDVVLAAEGKRAAAAAILAEAERMEASTRKLKDWLSRATGRNPLGHFSFEALPTPGLAAGQGITVEEMVAPAFGGIEDLDGPFGTDDPENLDSDSNAWSLPLTQEATIHGN